MSQVNTYLANDYYDTLLDIQKNYRSANLKFPLYTTEGDENLNVQPLIDIDLNKREIILPPEYQDFLSMERDHYAETVYFKVDRYFEDVDLFRTVIVVEYIDATGKNSRIFPVALKDIISEPGKIIFAWCIGNEATRVAGTIKFAVRFYLVNEQEKKFDYNLSTQPQYGNILHGMDEIDWQEEYADKFTPSIVEEVLAAIETAKFIYWTDV